MIGEGIVSKQTNVPGWHSDAESDALINLAQQYVSDDGVVVEIGGEYGKSAAEFGYALRDKKGIRIFTVDLFPVDHHVARQYGGLLNVWRANLAETGLGNPDLLFLPMPGDSADVADNWQEEIDLLFIDGDHTYEGVMRDISAWLHHVKPGGIVVFHDYARGDNAHPLHYEVKRAIDGYFNNPAIKPGYWKRIDLPDSLVAFERNAEFKETAKDDTSAKVETSATPKPAAKKATAKRPGRKPKTSK